MYHYGDPMMLSNGACDGSVILFTSVAMLDHSTFFLRRARKQSNLVPNLDLIVDLYLSTTCNLST